MACDQHSAALTPWTCDRRRLAAELRQDLPGAPAGRALHGLGCVLGVIGGPAAGHASSDRNHNVANSCNAAAGSRTGLVLEVPGCTLDLLLTDRHNETMPEGKDAN